VTLGLMSMLSDSEDFISLPTLDIRATASTSRSYYFNDTDRVILGSKGGLTNRSSMIHEFGHFLEDEVYSIRKSTNNFLIFMALSEIEGGSAPIQNFESNVAFPDRLVHDIFKATRSGKDRDIIRALERAEQLGPSVKRIAEIAILGPSSQ